jgi:2-dehydro-3-deoxygalactonokinase
VSCVFVAVDWGTTSLRAYAVSDRGTALASAEAKHGIQSRQGEFEATLAEVLRRLPGSDGVPVLMAGMIGSQQGWVEAPYVETPCSAETLAQRLIDVPTALGRPVKIVPGVAHLGHGVPDVMRGEETQLLGLMSRDDLRTGSRVVCMPGTHCKWVRLRDSLITDLRTYMTGELFKLLSEHSLLARLMSPNGKDDVDDWQAFDRGLDRASQPGHLLHHLFAVRTEGLFKRQPATALKSYLSGILIGHEVDAACSELAPGEIVILVGDCRLTARYQRALQARGVGYESAPPDIIVPGLARIAQAAGWC